MKRWLPLSMICALSLANAATPIQTHGRLSVKGSQVIDEHGKPANLRGISLYWSQWAGKYYVPETINWLATDWGSAVVRAAMAIDQGGYLLNPDVEEYKIRKAVESAVARGMYVIIDWHEEKAVDHEAEAIDFFQRMATDYGKNPNVMYEIYNEPTSQSWGQIKGYAERVTKAIRAIDPTNLILVGSPFWSSEVDKPAADPLQGTNIAYSFHFYAATHGQDYRDRASAAMRSGIALFVTEWGTCESSGTGNLDYDNAKKWLAFMDDNNLSWANWSVGNKPETCSSLLGTASNKGGWTSADLTASGNFIRDEVRKRNGDYTWPSLVIDTFALPGTVDASKTVKTTGTRPEVDSLGQGNHLAYIDSGTSADYLVKTTLARTFTTAVHSASAHAGGAIRWSLDGNVSGTTQIGTTGAWQNWQTSVGPSFKIPAGTHTLHLDFLGQGTGMFNLDAIDFTASNTKVLAADRPVPTLRRIGHFVEVDPDPVWNQASIWDIHGREIARADLRQEAARLDLGTGTGVVFLRLDGIRPQTVILPIGR